MPNFKVKKLKDFVDFRKAKPGDAGYDLYATHPFSIWPGVIEEVHTGVAVSCPPDYYFRVAPRSGLASKGVLVLGGVVDSSYRGEVIVLLTALNAVGSKTFARGDRVAQLIPTKIASEEVEFVEELVPTERGGDGFGSTGR